MFINVGFFSLRDLIRYYNIINPFNTLNIIRIISLIIPHFAYSACIARFIQIAWENNMCKICKSSFTAEKCKSKYLIFFFILCLPRLIILYFNILDPIYSERKSYFVFKSSENPNGILEETLFLLFSSIVYIIIILLIDYKIFHRLYQFVFNKIIGTGKSYRDVNEDPDVGGERDKVDAAKTHSSN